jgi:hypothetical protein
MQADVAEGNKNVFFPPSELYFSNRNCSITEKKRHQKQGIRHVNELVRWFKGGTSL